MPSINAARQVPGLVDEKNLVKRGVSGPLLVSLGAAGWGAEGLFRRRLGELRLPALPIVLVEHVLQVLFTFPALVASRRLLRAVPLRALGWVALSGAFGSSLGTVCYTAALATDINPTAAAMILNLQPVVSTLAGALLFRERISRGFYLWAAVAMGAGVCIAFPKSSELAALQHGWAVPAGLALVFSTVILWGFATAAGRGAMREMPLGLGAPLRLWAGLVTTALVLAVRWATGQGGIDLAPFLQRDAIVDLLLLTTLTGALPLFVYFAGLASTPASLAGYCEMFYTVSATLIGWAILGGTLLLHQQVAAAALIVAIVQLNRVQRRSEGALPLDPRAAA